MSDLIIPHVQDNWPTDSETLSAIVEHGHRFGPKYVTYGNQMAVWAVWEKRNDLFTGGRFVPVHIPYLDGVEPEKVWTMYEYNNPNNPPSLPVVPIHNQNAFKEDRIHDWRIIGTQFRYYTRVMNESVWVLLEYKINLDF